MLPLYQRWIRAGIVTGELYDGPWANVGTPDDLAALDARAVAHDRLRRALTLSPLP